MEVVLKSYVRTGATAVLLVFSVVAAGCGKSKDEGNVQEKPARKFQKLNIDIDTEKKHQAAVDQGFQPWKRDVTEVAKECLINTGAGAPSGDCKILSNDEKEAKVAVNTKDGRFKVTLKRLVKPDGIWTATEIEKEE